MSTKASDYNLISHLSSPETMQSNITQSPLLSVEELETRTPRMSVLPTVALLRVRLTIPGPLDSAVVVVDEPHDPKSPFLPYQTLRIGIPVKHPISEEPVTYPAVSSLTTSVHEFDTGPTIWRYTQLIDLESEDDEEGRMVCIDCGAKGPLVPEPLTVKATSRPYVTVDDWTSQVYDYLMMHEGTIHKVTYTDNDNDFPEAGNLEICKVDYGSIELHEVKEGEAVRNNGLTADYVAKIKRLVDEARQNSEATP
ncbi:hypothetical protein F5X68DRAFT_261263 [Plectosphaerella plurivora]|uniref:Uncharacterized protein n=1 Tax=Plectosphaerella plurivora TaxID=936078 RepID=A0A9P9A8Z6_9PEZI|nr:hypothetical protein F5X68DRAFT_261263 [Plectosphaerella plurivora]